MRKKALAVLAMVMLVLMTACGSALAASGSDGKVYTLKISSSQTDQSLIVQAYTKLADRLKENSGGRLDVQVFPSSQLGNDEDVIEQAIQGADVAVNTDAARMGTYVKEMGILMMGYFADNYEECKKVTETAKFAKWEEELASQHGIRVLAFDFYDPDDLKKILVDTAREVGAESALVVVAEADAAEQRMKDAGLIVVEPDLTAFKATVEPAYEKLGYTALRNEIYAEIGKTK
jgi:TRAP-type C4-dicarboxylate transport system substrate-binding protein